jgi:tripartite ATP-independent transporter DctP family solute receptor
MMTFFEKNYRGIFTGLVIILLLSLVVGCGKDASTDGSSEGSEKKEVIKMRLGGPKAAKHPVSQGFDKFAELVEEKTNGEIVIETFHDSLLGSDRETIESAQQGTLEFGASSSANMASFTNTFIAWDLPYIFENKEEVYKAVDGEPGKVAAKELEEVGFKLIMFPDYGFRQIVNNEREVKIPSDLEGLKLRTTNSPIEQADFSAFGALPTPIAWAEVFTALQQGTVKGEGNSYSLLWDTKHQEALKYATEVNYIYSSDVLVMNKGIFDDLSAEHQEAIMAAAKEAVDWQRGLATGRDEEAKQQFIDYGIEVYEPTPEEMSEWKKAVKPVWDEFVVPGKADPEYVEMILETLGKTREDIFK